MNDEKINVLEKIMVKIFILLCLFGCFVIVDYSIDKVKDNLRDTQGVKTVFYAVPNIDTSFKTFMDYEKITNKASKQYEMQQKAITNNDGLRMYDGKYMIALGSYYSENCGDEFIITLDNNEKLHCILGDQKDDLHTNDTKQYIEKNGNLVEFIVETDKLPEKVKQMGDASFISEQFEGEILSIEKIVK